jgi:hypothetical protein
MPSYLVVTLILTRQSIGSLQTQHLNEVLEDEDIKAVSPALRKPWRRDSVEEALVAVRIVKKLQEEDTRVIISIEPELAFVVCSNAPADRCIEEEVEEHSPEGLCN